MATIQKFEDLICWQRARELTKFVYQISRYRKDMSTYRDSEMTKKENIDMSKYREGNISTYRNFDRGLADQIQRAAVSVMSNIAEGFDRGTKQELINYLFIAKGSCGEVRCQLYAALDAGYIDMSTFRNGLQLTDECARLIKSFINKVKVGSHSGMQYKKETRKGMSDMNKLLIKSDPALMKYYNSEKDEIEFWRRENDKNK